MNFTQTESKNAMCGLCEPSPKEVEQSTLTPISVLRRWNI